MTSPPTPPSADDQHAVARTLRVAVLGTSWYGEIIDSLRKAAHTTLQEAGVAAEHIRDLSVPGAFELPQAAAWLARAGEVDAIVALGCIVRGETPHFDFVAAAACDGLTRVAIDTGIPIGLGVITANTMEQAQDRSGPATGKGGNKGIEAADAALRMALLYSDLERERNASRGGLR